MYKSIYFVFEFILFIRHKVKEAINTLYNSMKNLENSVKN